MFAIPHRILTQRYKFDELYLWFIGNVFYPVTRWFAKTDYDFVDQLIVDGVGRTGTAFSWLSSLFDGAVVDRFLIDGQGTMASWAGKQLRRVQSGLAQSYLFWMIIGLAGMMAWIAHNFK
jgi:NADH:ubiquinone oxidoreductase subunit 5 (subunit L)/multisubunit Na+/H+ antiporter MnhA subunit